MQLLGSGHSPFARKVRIVLAEKNIPYEWVAEDVWSADTKMSAVNPLGKEPCLVTDYGEAIFDSRVIVEYLDQASTANPLIPPRGRAHLEVRLWEAMADGLMDAATTARLEQTWKGRRATERSQAWIERQMKKVHDTLQVMEQRLAGGSWCIAGGHLTLADLGVGSALSYLDFRFPQLGWRTSHPGLARLYDAQLQVRASFQSTALSDH
ncbi:glutathione S-transferase N-terminal domain-containing protein [Castellaniella sp.]|uniref:glutathione S-transferase N-terminal domain-containing protein n=1 Tax=Castellaniella sp. TaxID=1955812 RepID=UPI00355F91B7